MSHIERSNRTTQLAVSRATAAEMLDISTSTFDKWIDLGWMPRGFKIGGLRRWYPEDLHSYLHALVETNSTLEHEDAENPFDYAVG